jgi:hypothetical protein
MRNRWKLFQRLRTPRARPARRACGQPRNSSRSRSGVLTSMSAWSICRWAGSISPESMITLTFGWCQLPDGFRGRSAHADELELLGGQLVPATVTRPVAGCSDVSDPRVPHVARTRVARAFTPQSVCRSLAVDVELEVVAVWLEVAVHRLRELVAVARNERR